MEPRLSHALLLYFADRNITNKAIQQQHGINLKQCYHPDVAGFNISLNGKHKELFLLQKTTLAIDHLLVISRQVSRQEIDKYYVVALLKTYVKGVATEDIERVDVHPEMVYVYLSRRSYFFKPTVIKIRRV